MGALHRKSGEARHSALSEARKPVQMSGKLSRASETGKGILGNWQGRNEAKHENASQGHMVVYDDRVIQSERGKMGMDKQSELHRS